MKIFLDTADTLAIERYADTGLIDGVTTNPTLIMKSGRDPRDVYHHIKDIGIQDISMEVMGDFDQMYAEGYKLAKEFGDVATIKLPCTREGLQVCKVLSGEGIRINVTLVFSAAQAVLASKAGATYVSPFIGRLDDLGVDGMELIHDLRMIYDNYGFETEILAASIRSAAHVQECAIAGADVATVPPAVLKGLVKHQLTDKGLAAFLEDWKKTGQSL